MGLDWNPGNRPKPGCEAEFRDLLRKLRANVWQWPSDTPYQRYLEISITPYETLRAPRVGYDLAADEWAKGVYDPSQHGRKDDFLARMRGFYVVSLVPPCDGLPRYTNGTPGGYVEPFSFRGESLFDCDVIVPQDLLQSAYESKLNDEFHGYGNSLMQCCISFTREHRIDLANAWQNKDPTSIDFKADVAYSAAKWCLFWAAEGHMLEAYF